MHIGQRYNYSILFQVFFLIDKNIVYRTKSPTLEFQKHNRVFSYELVVPYIYLHIYIYLYVFQSYNTGSFTEFAVPPMSYTNNHGIISPLY